MDARTDFRRQMDEFEAKVRKEGSQEGLKKIEDYVNGFLDASRQALENDKIILSETDDLQTETFFRGKVEGGKKAVEGLETILAHIESLQK